MLGWPLSWIGMLCRLLQPARRGRTGAAHVLRRAPAHAAHASGFTSVDSVCRRAKNVREGRSRSVCSTISPVIASTDSDSWRARSCKPQCKARPLDSAWIFIHVYAGTSNKVVCDGKLEQPRPRGRCRITCAPGFVRTQEDRRQPCTSDEGTRDDAWTMLQTSSDFALAYCSP